MKSSGQLWKVIGYGMGGFGADLVTVLLLVMLEGLLSVDNALVLAVMVMPLPEEERGKALRIGLIGAFVLRIIATLLAVWLASMSWLKLVGGLYLLYLPYKHFTSRSEGDSAEGGAAAVGGTLLGLSLFWSTVVKDEMINLVFAVESSLAAVAMSHTTWVIVTGGLLGVVMMRVLTMQVLELVRRYPKLIDGAYVIIAWVGLKLFLEYLHVMKWVELDIPNWLSIGLVVVLFVGSFVYAKRAAEKEALAAAESYEPVDLHQPAELVAAEGEAIPSGAESALAQSKEPD